MKSILEDNMLIGNEEDGEDDIESEGGDENSDEDDEQDTDGFDEEEDDIAEEDDEDERESRKRKLSEEEEMPSKEAKLEDEDQSLYKLPTVDELNRLRETQMLFHSNLFRMQMEELLLEVSVKDKHRHKLNQWLNQFTSFVKSLPQSPAYQLSATKWLKENNVVDPLTLPESKGSFQFIPPTEVKFVGGAAAGTLLSTDETVDVMLVLPKEIVTFKDFKDGRWLAKRSKYLSWIAFNIQGQSDLVAGVNWTYHLGNSSRPVLQVTPASGIGKKWKVNLFPVPDATSFKLSLFSPERWTVTPTWYFGDEGAKEEEFEATPHCNWSSAIDVIMQDHLEHIGINICQHSNLIQGIKLMKVWLAQRYFNKGLRTMSSHVISMLVIHLLQVRKINSQMSGYQVFRTVILTLDSVDWIEKGMCMRNDTGEDVPSLERLCDLYEVVFMDPSGRVNLVGNLMKEDFLLLKHEAQLALQILNSSSADSFDFLFMKKREFYQLCDQVLSLKLNKKKLKKIVKKHGNLKQHELDALGDLRFPAWSAVMKTLKRGLGDRVMLLVPESGAVPSWPVGESPPKGKSSLVIGFVLDEIAAKALLTKGPAADDPEGKNFREFWGEKSNLRRFQDGSFHEAVLWGTVNQPVGDRRLIPGSVAKYILNFHYDMEDGDVNYICQGTESILRLGHCRLPRKYGTGEESTVEAIQAFDAISRKLRSLDLPLKITSVQSTSEVGRHTSVFPPIVMKFLTSGKGLEVCESRVQFATEIGEVPPYTYAIEVNVFLETSGKWPDNLVAIQAIKAEFYKTMASQLTDNGIAALTFPKYLQVLWNGYIFHVKVCYRREIYLSRLVANDDGVLREQDTDAAIKLETELEILPRITSALASVQADHPSFNSGVRLCKRWVGSQLLLPHVPHMAVDLLVTYLYTNPAPYDAPHTPHVLFLRFLSLLAHTDWRTTPILVNLRDTFTVEDVTELNRRFTSERSSLPPMFIATPYELRGSSSSVDDTYRYRLASMWTMESPSLPIIYRCKQLASAALDYMTKAMLKNTFDIKLIFRPSLDDFNVVIKLQESHLSRRKESVDASVPNPKFVKPYKYQRKESMPIVMFDPAEKYLTELREAFSHLALFFHDEFGGNVIGLVWKPSALPEQELKIGSLEGHRIFGVKTVKQAPNMEAILSDIEIMGEGLVESVTINDKT
ncbi:nucleolar protein 6 isoform X1 [Palaemon carinicauda]|uniref:nucleolar protein 6 isoform X1 n=1 Tax=Palaemon carinicauda TaxID=392227 RepID=UPI0035B5A04E